MQAGLRARVEKDRAKGSLSPAKLVEPCECEPALEGRTEPVRALLSEPAAALDRAGEPGPLFEPQLRALTDRVGPERLAALGEDAKLARAPRDHLEGRPDAPTSHKEQE